MKKPTSNQCKGASIPSDKAKPSSIKTSSATLYSDKSAHSDGGDRPTLRKGK